MKTIPICGYPRSGNTYLSYAIQMLYYPSQTPHLPRHTTQTIKNYPISIVPFRNPLDSIASWAWFYPNISLDKHVTFYNRFYSYILNNLSKVILFDFIKFVDDISYIVDKVSFLTQSITPASCTIADIKTEMRLRDKTRNLPAYTETNVIKLNLKRNVDLRESYALHTALGNAA